MRGSLFLLACVLLPAPARAAGKNRDVGTGAGNFLKLGADARGTAMGQSVSAFAEDASSVYWNPAGLAGLAERHATLTHTILFQTMFEDFVAYAQPIQSILGTGGAERYRELRSNPYGAVGVGALYLNSGSISEVDNTGAFTGQGFTPHDYAVIASWGASLTEFLDVGISGKYVSSSIEATASTGAADAGTKLKFRLGPFPAALALGARNLGGTLKYNLQADPLPLTFDAGLSLRLTENWAVAAQAAWPRDKSPYGAAGMELRFPVREYGAFFLRAGYNGQTESTGLSGLAGLTGGGGLRAGWFGLDYAWEPFGVLQDIHRFTMSFRF